MRDRGGLLCYKLKLFAAAVLFCAVMIIGGASRLYAWDTPRFYFDDSNITSWRDGKHEDSFYIFIKLTDEGKRNLYATTRHHLNEKIEFYIGTTFYDSTIVRDVITGSTGMTLVMNQKKHDQFVPLLPKEKKEVPIPGETELQKGNDYYWGHHVEKDREEAIKWYRKAADLGNVNAQFLLGEAYYNGRGVTKDYKNAVEWFRKAAERGDDNSQYMLGRAYYFGSGVNKNYGEAFKWWHKAADHEAIYHDSDVAQKALERYEK